jgi:LPXTG-motif cell wall-anchored protein
MYYENGWKASIDGKETKIHRVNYAFRGLEIPAGKHTVSFKFEPQVVKTGSKIALITSVIVLLLLIGGLFILYQKRNA